VDSVHIPWTTQTAGPPWTLDRGMMRAHQNLAAAAWEGRGAHRDLGLGQSMAAERQCWPGSEVGWQWCLELGASVLWVIDTCCQWSERRRTVARFSPSAERGDTWAILAEQ
jgi:hypothetical protein